MATTPPPPSSIQTPATPRFGYHDDYQPYSPRKSTRVQRARTAQTPPPQSITPQHISPRSSRKRIAIESSSDNLSAPNSPQTATKRKTLHHSNIMGGRRVSGRLDSESTASAADALGLPRSEPTQQQPSRSIAAVRNMGMLPTPDKTPKKAPKEIAPQIRSVARSLFTSRGQSDDELMPSRKNKKKSGYTIDSFEDHMQSEQAEIPIFTDSNDRVPEVDESAENPFYGNGAAVEPPSMKRSSKQKKIKIPGEGEVTLEEAEAREDGLVYVFRGKKMFRKFESEEGSADEEDDLDRSVPSSLRGPRTRSSLKPRLLFVPPKREPTTTDEEADTDIEDNVATPSRQAKQKMSTPRAPKFAPASPPTTVRATRSRNIDMDRSPGGGPATPRGRGKKTKTSPFDMWQRTRDESSSRKRDASESLDRGGEKRARV